MLILVTDKKNKIPSFIKNSWYRCGNRGHINSAVTIIIIGAIR